MAVQQRRTLSNRMVAALTVERDTVFWDQALTGFGVRVYPSGGKVYVVQARGPKGQKRVTVGRHGVIGAAEARRRAALIILRIKTGEEPVPLPLEVNISDGPTVAELAARYLEEHVTVSCKPATARDTRSAIRRHILPALGRLPLEAVEPGQVSDLHRRLARSPAIANKAVRTLSHMYTLADRWGMVGKAFNPCRSVTKYPERKRKRHLNAAELDRLEQALDEAASGGGISAGAVAAIRLLMVTACRKNEILTLRWEDLDIVAGEIRLRGGKAGVRTVLLPPSTVRILDALPRKKGNPWVFPGRKPGTHRSEIDTAWCIVRARAELDDLHIHDLRRGFLPRTRAFEASPAMMEQLPSRSDGDAATRYAHLAGEPIREAMERIANSIAADIL